MKKLALFIIALIGYVGVYSQQAEYHLSQKDWNDIIVVLTAEKWGEAEKLSAKFMKKFNDDNSDDAAILRYMYIRSVSAQLGDHKYSKAAALKKVNGMVGKLMITPPREFNPKRMFNGLKVSEDGDSFITCSSNSDMTVIHCFEYYFFKDPSIVKSPENYTGKSLRLAAYIKSIDAAGDSMPRFEINLENAFIWDEK